MKAALVLSLLVSIFVGCKKEGQYKPVQISCSLTKDLGACRAMISGTWTWLEEKRVNQVQQGFVYLTPKTEGYRLSLQLSNGMARFFKNNRPDSVYTYKVVRLTEISGTNFPEDNDPVLVLYSLENGLRRWHVPIKICQDYLVLQYQHVRSVEGEEIWKRQ